MPRRSAPRCRDPPSVASSSSQRGIFGDAAYRRRGDRGCRGIGDLCRHGHQLRTVRRGRRNGERFVPGIARLQLEVFRKLRCELRRKWCRRHRTVDRPASAIHSQLLRHLQPQRLRQRNPDQYRHNLAAGRHGRSRHGQRQRHRHRHDQRRRHGGPRPRQHHSRRTSSDAACWGGMDTP